MRHLALAVILAAVVVLGLPAAGQPAPAGTAFRGLSFSTPYPAQTVRAGETQTLVLTLRNFGLPPQVVTLRVLEAPRGWRATFLGGGRPISAVYVGPDQEATVTLRIESPPILRPGTYRFRLLAEGPDASRVLPLAFTLGSAEVRRLSLEAELPVLRGAPTASFRYRLTLRNESDQEALVNLDAQTPQGFQVNFSLFGQQVASVPLKAGESRDIDAEVALPARTPAGTYPLTVRALSGDARAEVALKLEITGRPELSVTAPDGRLSGRAYAGRDSPVKVIVKNTGSAPARNVSLSSFPPSGWQVTFTPERVDEIAPNGQAEVTATIRPSPKALTGDYMVTMTASAGDVSQSADFRITVATSTLWGLVGVLVVAAGLGVVTFAVNRYGRR
jgi:uncharacterized membrane protein